MKNTKLREFEIKLRTFYNTQLFVSHIFISFISFLNLIFVRVPK